MNKDAINRLITEAMGECWHERNIEIHKGRRCIHCGIEWDGTPIDYTSNTHLASLILWLKGEHPAVSVTCWGCEGTGKEICDNPDHGFIEGMAGVKSGGKDIQRLGCPCCGHDPQHIIKNSVCDLCHGRGTTRLRKWTYKEFIMSGVGVYEVDEPAAGIRGCVLIEDIYLDPPTLAGVIGEFLQTLKEG